MKKDNRRLFLFSLVALIARKPNVAGQWRAALDTQYETETQSARPLKQPGWAEHMRNGRSWLGTFGGACWRFLHFDRLHHAPGETKAHAVVVADPYGAVPNLFEHTLVC